MDVPALDSMVRENSRKKEEEKRAEDAWGMYELDLNWRCSYLDLMLILILIFNTC